MAATPTEMFKKNCKTIISVMSIREKSESNTESRLLAGIHE
jgi:hypothetical protein